MVDDVLLHPELLQQTCTLQCFSCLHRNGFLTVVGLHFIFRHRIGGEEPPVCEEPSVQSCLHQWVLHGPLPLCRSVHILLLGKGFSRANVREIVPWLIETLCVSWSHVIKFVCVSNGCFFLCSQRAIRTSLVMFVLVDLFKAIVLWFWLWLQLWLWVAAIPTWMPQLANVTNGASGELFNDPLFNNILSKLIQNPRSRQ